MFGVGAGEVLVILLVALIIFGPKRLPEIGKTVGKGLREFRKATQDIRSDVEGAMSDDGTKPAAPSVSSDVSSTNGWGPEGTRIPTSEVPQVGSVPASPNGPAGEAGGAPRLLQGDRADPDWCAAANSIVRARGARRRNRRGANP